MNPKLLKAIKKNPPKNPTIYDKSFYKGFVSVAYQFKEKRLIISLKSKKTISFNNALQLAEYIDSKVKIISVINVTKLTSEDYHRKGKNWNTVVEE